MTFKSAMRTSLGAAVYVFLTLSQALISIFGNHVIDSIGVVDYNILWHIGSMVPLTLHICVSHRDEQSVLSAIEDFFRPERRESSISSSISSSLRAYRSKTIETLEAEYSEIINQADEWLQADETGSISTVFLKEN